MDADPADSMTSLPSAPSTAHGAADDWSTLFGGLPVGAFRTTPDGRFVRVNLALARMHGFATEAELLAAVDDLAVDWFVLPGRRAEILAAIELDGSARGLVSEIYHQKTRQRMWISENAYVIRDAEGRVAFYEGTVEEVTERVNTQQALEQREALLRDVTAGVPGMVYRVQITPEGALYYDFVSDGVRELYGVEPAAVLADPQLLRRLRHPDDDARVQAALQAHLAGRQPATIEFRIRPPHGAEKWIRLTASSTAAALSDRVLHGVAVDITAAKQVEQAARESERRWKLTLERLGDAVWEVDLVDGTGEISGPLSETFDLPGHGSQLSMREFEGLVHPDDRAAMVEARRAFREGRAPTYSSEHRMRQQGRWVGLGAQPRRGRAARRQRQAAASPGNAHRHHPAPRGRGPAPAARPRRGRRPDQVGADVTHQP